MAGNKTIEQLIAASSLSVNNDGVIVQDGITKKTQVQLYVDLISGLIALGSNVSFGTTVPTGGKASDVYIKTDSGQMYQNQAGLWAVVYTLPSPGSGTSLRYGTGAPLNSLGANSDSYIDTNTGIFYQKASGVYTQKFTITSGPAGPRGNSVLNGTVAPDISIGVSGDFYLNTTGYVIYGPKTGGGWGTGTQILIIPNQLRYGNGNPLNTLGIDGDFYLNTANYTIFGPKASGVWPSGVSLLYAPLIIEVDFPSGSSTDLDYTNVLIPDVAAEGMEVYAEQYYTDATIDPTMANIFIPYTITVFKITATNHLLFRKSAATDHVKVTIKI